MFSEYLDGEPVFRRADRHPLPARDEIELALDQIFEEELGEDINWPNYFRGRCASR